MKKTLMMVAVAAFAIGGLTAAPEAHAATWKKCGACHNFTAKNKVGPGLKDVIGRKAGTHPGFRYSPSLKNGGWTWDDAHLRQWMCNSKDAIKKFTGDPKARVRMPPQHVCEKDRQDNVLAKLHAISK